MTALMMEPAASAVITSSGIASWGLVERAARGRQGRFMRQQRAQGIPPGQFTLDRLSKGAHAARAVMIWMEASKLVSEYSKANESHRLNRGRP